MEFLKSCNTNAQAIGEFEAVAFQAFTVRRDSTKSSAKLQDENTSEDLHVVEAEFRQGRHLVIQDAGKALLWFFRATTPDRAGQMPMAVPVLEGYIFKAEQSGVMKASELARTPPRNPSPQTPSSAISASPSTPGPFKGPQSANLRAAHAGQNYYSSEQPPLHDSYAIYELFVSSVIALISFTLVKDHGAVALNYRSFLLNVIDQSEADTYGRAQSGTSSLCLTNLDAYWTSSGALVVSTLSIPKSDMQCLNEINGEVEQARLAGKCVRVAPSGTLAQIVNFQQPVEATAEDSDQCLQRKRPKLQPSEKSVDKWKGMVRRWLKWKGYSSFELDKKESWVRIRVAHVMDSVTPASSPSFPGHFKEVLWPAKLCFYCATPDNKLQRQIHGLPDDPLEWFETSDSEGFRDPVDIAQQWFLGKDKRDKAFEARHKARLAEEEAAHKEEAAGLYPSSPLHARTGAYGDLQATGGVYPTPPDGVIALTTAPPSSTNPAISGAISGADQVLAPGGNYPAINLSAPQDHGTGQNQNETSPDLQLPFDHFTTTMQGGHDDLFEDMDEDVLDGVGVTDADFNFFDEPGGQELKVTESQPTEQALEPTAKRNRTVPSAELTFSVEEPQKAVAEVTLSTLTTTSGDLTTKPKHHEHEKAPAHPNKTDAEPPRSAGSIRVDPDPPNDTTGPSSPLSPLTIKKKLLLSPENKMSFHHRVSNGHGSIFDPVSFNQKMSLSDAKYHRGRFSLPLEQYKKASDWTKTPPINATNPQALLFPTKLRNAIDLASNQGEKYKVWMDVDDSDLTESSSELSSLEDEEKESNFMGPGPLWPGSLVPGKRKLHADGNATPLSVASFAESLGTESQDQALFQIDDNCLQWFEPNPWDWSLVNLPPPVEMTVSTPRKDILTLSPIFSSMPNTPTSQPEFSVEPPEEKYVLSGKDSIAVAQIITDQIVSATLDLFYENISVLKAADTAAIKETWDQNRSETKVQGVVKFLFPKATQCNAIGLASVQDVLPDIQQLPKGQPRPPPRKMNAQADGSATPVNLVFPISPPCIRVRRADALWDMLPPALSFWEPLGLSPSSRPKNVVAFCVYPHSDAIRPCLENFLLNVQLAYESCRFGNHSRVETIPEYANGLVPWRMSHATSAQTPFKALRDICIPFGKLLSAKHAHMRAKDGSQKIDAFVIYIVNPFQTASSIWELCSAFWTLFQAYGPGSQPRSEFSPKPDLVLQIVPIHYLASFDIPVFLNPSVYRSLAREVYDRCPPSVPSEDKTPLSIYSAPSFQLEEPVPRIQFKLTAEPPPDLLRENSCMHVGYAVSLDGMWITAAWTDSSAKSQAVVSYNVGTRSFGDIAREIWQTTIDILQSRRVTWRICLAKAGAMEREELETWIFLASCPTKLNLFPITLLTVDTTPNLRLIPTIPTGPFTNPPTSSIPSNTPGSTPQPGVSPEQPGLTPAATPSENAIDPSTDPDARLVDVTDETWGIILSHRLHNTNSTVEFRPVLISGLLVKRGEEYSTSSSSFQIADHECGPIVVGVNILWVGAVGSTRAATSPFPTSTTPGEGVSPGGMGVQWPPERSATSWTWTADSQSRARVENLLKDVLGQYRALGLLAKLKGMRGTRHGTVPWHVAAALRGVKAVSRCS
ncbi:hypothetical protein GQ43DRAFT_368263 [Delitschia confertaspora ATCC 74209]|uniref:Mediator of RNA polymerase II transcription subunit 13 n=1 Tax=Delitschia confertaspora ATCC 74209 TaxID=1513339 RepID=A0A9P4JP22_9PLEO|nr:hypothetical protein GQ43DRAFT_368263 [Delitschia confertaspora ATCC 74209]